MKHTLVALVENQPGVLQRVANLFSRRGFNIESLTVGHTETDRTSRMTIVIDGNKTQVEQVIKQLYKLIDGQAPPPPMMLEELMQVWTSNYVMHSNGSTKWRMTQSSQAPKRVWACSSSRLCTVRASTEKAALMGLAKAG